MRATTILNGLRRNEHLSGRIKQHLGDSFELNKDQVQKNHKCSKKILNNNKAFQVSILSRNCVISYSIVV